MVPGRLTRRRNVMNREERLEKQLSDKLDTGARRARHTLTGNKEGTHWDGDPANTPEFIQAMDIKALMVGGDFAGDSVVLPILDAISNDRDYIPHTNEGKQGLLDDDRKHAHSRPPVPFPGTLEDYGADYTPRYSMSDQIGIFLLGLAVGVLGTVLYIIARLPNVAKLSGLN